jgi:septal ring-binding cell division protein DamX
MLVGKSADESVLSAQGGQRKGTPSAAVSSKPAGSDINLPPADVSSFAAPSARLDQREEEAPSEAAQDIAFDQTPAFHAEELKDVEKVSSSAPVAHARAGTEALADPETGTDPDTAAIRRPERIPAGEPVSSVFASGLEGTPGADAGTSELPKDPETTRFGIQLIAYRDSESVAEFAKEHTLGSQASYTKVPSSGGDWYVVLLSLFETREEAYAALQELPPRLKRLGPIVGRFPASQQLLPIE